MSEPKQSSVHRLNIAYLYLPPSPKCSIQTPVCAASSHPAYIGTSSRCWIPSCPTGVSFFLSSAIYRADFLASQRQAPVAIMSNPNRGRGGLGIHAARPVSNGDGGPPVYEQGRPMTNSRPAPSVASVSSLQPVMKADNQPPSHDNGAPSRGGAVHQHPRGAFRGRGFIPHDRGRGGRGYRGRGRGVVSRPVEPS